MQIRHFLRGLSCSPLFKVVIRTARTLPPRSQMCTPGEREMCTGADGCSGFQECTPSNGQRLSTCICDPSVGRADTGSRGTSMALPVRVALTVP